MTDDTLTRVRATLARLAEVEREATPGPWRQSDYAQDDARIESEAQDEHHWPLLVIYDEGGHDARDAAATVALRNAAPALLALAEAVVRDRQARVVVRGLLQSVSRGETEEAMQVAGVLAESLAVRGAAEDAIDAALAALADDVPGEVQP